MSTSNNRTTDEAQIRVLVENWEKAVRAEDMDGIIANHAPDILLFDVPPPLQSRGIEAYRKSWEVFFAWFQGSGVFDISELSVAAGNDVAFCHGIIRCGGTETNGEKVELLVRLTICCRKLDGQWTVTHEHHSEPSST